MLAKRVLRCSSTTPAVASSSQSRCYERRSISSSTTAVTSTESIARHPSSGQTRAYSLEQQTVSHPPPDDALFSSKPTWDALFQNIGDARPVRSHTTSQPSPRPAPNRILGGGAVPRRQSMTIREMTAFDDMFSRIFNAANSNTRNPPSGPFYKELAKGVESYWDPFTSGSIGRPRAQPTTGEAALPQKSEDLFAQIRKHSKKLQWTSEADEEFDRKKEEMSLCETDHQLLEWAQREVFNESRRFEELARTKLAQGSSSQEAVQLQPLSYPHLIGHLMRTFRDKYNDPHLALSIFSHARHLSIPSFVFGCTTSAYNELLETKWRCFRDLRGVCDSLEEMQVNGVPMDSRTKALCELVRKECGERELWSEERNVGSGEVWEMVNFIDKVVAGVADDLFGESTGKRRAHSGVEKKEELGSWKTRAFSKQGKDQWEFGRWDDEREPGSDDEKLSFA